MPFLPEDEEGLEAVVAVITMTKVVNLAVSRIIFILSNDQIPIRFAEIQPFHHASFILNNNAIPRSPICVTFKTFVLTICIVLLFTIFIGVIK